jgi:Glutamate dehydrogenase/leucine dehydrogenase
MDDKGQVQVNRGFPHPAQHGHWPLQGRHRFHPSVNQSVLKFLALNKPSRTR